jgi:hypothetical protein
LNKSAHFLKRGFGVDLSLYGTREAGNNAGRNSVSKKSERVADSKNRFAEFYFGRIAEF